jgi:hypothetical protein
MKQISLLLQLAHDVTDGRRRDPEPEPSCDRLTAGRLGRLDVAVHDRLENAQLALSQLVLARHPGNLEAALGSEK